MNTRAVGFVGLGGVRRRDHAGVTFCKDLSIIADFATQSQSPTPLFTAAAAHSQSAVAPGRSDQDTASVFAVLNELSR